MKRLANTTNRRVEKTMALTSAAEQNVLEVGAEDGVIVAALPPEEGAAETLSVERSHGGDSV